MDIIYGRNDPENWVAKSNKLIDSTFKMTINEQKLIITLASYISPEDKEFKTYNLSIKEFIDLLGLNSHSKYEELRNITESLMQKVYNIKIDGKHTQISWLSYVSYNDGEGSIDIRFDKFWKPYLLELKREYTTYRLKNILNLNSTYSIRMYELLVQFLGIGKRTLELTDLRSKLGVDEGTYPLYGNFKQRILLRTQKELEEKTDIKFTFKEIKKGRSVHRLIFNIDKNPKNQDLNLYNIRDNQKKLPKADNINEGNTDENNLESELLNLGVSPIKVKEIIGKFDTDTIKRNIEYTHSEAENRSLSNVAGFVIKAIEDDYAKNQKTSISTPVNSGEVIPDWFIKRNEKPDPTPEDPADMKQIESSISMRISLKKLSYEGKLDTEDEHNAEFNLVLKNDVKEILSNNIEKRKEFDLPLIINPMEFKDPFIRRLSFEALSELEEEGAFQTD